METTSISLLEQLRKPLDQEAWERFVRLYTPLMNHWARRLNGQGQDAEDLVQDVFALLVRKLPEFRYNRRKSFRGWLWTVTLNKWRQKRRQRAVAEAASGPDALALLEDPAGPDAVENAEYREYLVGRALQLMQSEFRPTTWKACWQLIVAGRPAEEVAAELGMGIDAVYAAKSRVLRRLRRELEGLID
jgi:RNA polymerase sigma-70 factor (ECF subfamily)